MDEWISVVLSPETNNQLWVPVGFGHGFCTLEPNSIISYRVTNYYSPEHDKGVAWDDPDIGVEWPEIADPDTLSAKDRAAARARRFARLFFDGRPLMRVMVTGGAGFIGSALGPAPRARAGL